jgi:hypothetical protein
VVSRLEAQIADTVAKEAEERDRAAEEARIAAGAFPVLSSGSASTPPPHSSRISDTHANSLRHLNLPRSSNAMTTKVTLTSYSKTSPPSVPNSRAEESEEERTRVPRPPMEVDYVKRPLDSTTFRGDFRNREVKYIPPARVDDENDSLGGGHTRRNKIKGQES